MLHSTLRHSERWAGAGPRRTPRRCQRHLRFRLPSLSLSVSVSASVSNASSNSHCRLSRGRPDREHRHRSPSPSVPRPSRAFVPVPTPTPACLWCQPQFSFQRVRWSSGQRQRHRAHDPWRSMHAHKLSRHTCTSHLQPGADNSLLDGYTQLSRGCVCVCMGPVKTHAAHSLLFSVPRPLVLPACGNKHPSGCPVLTPRKDKPKDCPPLHSCRLPRHMALLRYCPDSHEL